MILLVAGICARGSIAGSLAIAWRSEIEPCRVMAQVPGSAVHPMAARVVAADVRRSR